MLKAESLSFAFDYPLFADVSLNIAAKESAAVLGVSGSGKSTLLHILSTFLQPGSGRVLLQGTDIYALKPTAFNLIRRELIGLIFQQHYLFRGFSARENLEVASLLKGEMIDYELLERLGIAHILNQDAMSLSGGQQQRLSIARVLTKKPKFIFADEPTGNLDKTNAADAMNILFDYAVRENGVLFLVTHDEAIAERATHCYRLENGALTQIR